MKKINDLADEVQKFIEGVMGKAEKPVKEVLEFAKKHRRLIFVVVATYVAFKYLFGEKEESVE